MLTTTLHPAFQTPIETEIDGIKVNTNALLSDLLQSPGALIDIAREHKLTLLQLIVWCDQPAVRNLLDQADALAARIAAHKSAQARPGAIHTLATQTQLLETVKDRDTARKSARVLVGLPAPTHSEPQPIAEIHLPRPARIPRKHPANSRRAALPVPTDPGLDSIRIPVYRFRPAIGPMSSIGPIQLTPYELVDTAHSTPHESSRQPPRSAPSGTMPP